MLACRLPIELNAPNGAFDGVVDEQMAGAHAQIPATFPCND